MLCCVADKKGFLMPTSTCKRLFTVAEYERMVQVGIFAEDDRLELINGEILEMSPIGSRHAACVRRLQQLFTRQLGDRALVDVQNPLLLHDRSEPLPDVMLLKPQPDFYAAGHPRPDDVLLVIEVADTSLAYDRDIKVPVYASSGIPEVWVVDLTSATVWVYRVPAPDGYQEVTDVRGPAHIAPQAFPGLRVAVESIVG
jgi:Uma2 family endonuclease